MLMVTCLCSGKGKNPHIITNVFTEEMVWYLGLVSQYPNGINEMWLVMWW